MGGSDIVGSVAWWKPDRFSARRHALAKRAEMTIALREFFKGRGYVEVETPALQRSPGLEPHLTAFETAFVPTGGGRYPLYLQTSPEYAMKKLLVAGMDRIWQLARSFRNGERSATHHPEFAMLEWYRSGAGWRDIAGEALELIHALAGPSLRWRGHDCDLSRPLYLSMEEAFRHYAGLDLRTMMVDFRHPDRDGLHEGAQACRVRTAPSDRWEDIFYRLFLERIEPHLGVDVPVVLHSWPVAMAALSRPDEDDPTVAERFEVYACTLELANGFGELTDAVEQRRRFDAEIALRRQLDHDIYPVDEDFLAALETGLPECSGIALGFDRLVMLATGAERIEDVLWAPVSDPGW